MRQLIAFTKKEFLEQLRTGKLTILVIIFCLFGIMNPAVAKLTPWMMDMMSEQLAESGMIINDIEVSAMTSWTQFFKNMPIVLIIFIVMFSGILTAEYQKGTLVNIITKGMKRWKILASKTAVMIIFWTAGCLISYVITYVYNAYFWDNGIVNNLVLSVFCFYLTGFWLISIIPLTSALFTSASAVTLSAGGAYIAAYLLGLVAEVKKFTPVHLLDSMDLLTGITSGRQYYAAIAITIILIVINVIMSVIFFNKRTI